MSKNILCPECGLHDVEIEVDNPMSNSTQNDHETHTACIDRIMKEGAGAACCYCSPHKGCTLYVKPSTQNDYEHDYVVDIVNIVGVTIDASQYKKIDKILADARKEVIEKVEKELEGLDCGFCNYEKEVKERLATLREEES